MKVKKENVLDKEVVQIYLSRDEAENTNIKEKVNEIKANNKNVVLFVSGEEDIRTALQFIISRQAV